MMNNLNLDIIVGDANINIYKIIKKCLKNNICISYFSKYRFVNLLGVIEDMILSSNEEIKSTIMDIANSNKNVIPLEKIDKLYNNIIAIKESEHKKTYNIMISHMYKELYENLGSGFLSKYILKEIENNHNNNEDVLYIIYNVMNVSDVNVLLDKDPVGADLLFLNPNNMNTIINQMHIQKIPGTYDASIFDTYSEQFPVINHTMIQGEDEELVASLFKYLIEKYNLQNNKITKSITTFTKMIKATFKSKSNNKKIFSMFELIKGKYGNKIEYLPITNDTIIEDKNVFEKLNFIINTANATLTQENPINISNDLMIGDQITYNILETLEKSHKDIFFANDRIIKRKMNPMIKYRNTIDKVLKTVRKYGTSITGMLISREGTHIAVGVDDLDSISEEDIENEFNDKIFLMEERQFEIIDSAMIDNPSGYILENAAMSMMNAMSFMGLDEALEEVEKIFTEAKDKKEKNKANRLDDPKLQLDLESIENYLKERMNNNDRKENE